MEKKEIKINAENKAIGRIATEVANCLRGKNTAGFCRNATPNISVKVINISKIKTSERKMEQKLYKKHTGYPGSLRYISLKSRMDKNPKEAFKKIVAAMLPKNKLQKIFLKRLSVEL